MLKTWNLSAHPLHVIGSLCYFCLEGAITAPFRAHQLIAQNAILHIARFYVLAAIPWHFIDQALVSHDE